MPLDLGKSRQDFEKRLDIISKAWGRNRGYVFLAWIDREEQAASGTRKAGFYEHPYQWPRDREKIIIGMEEHWGHDAYWCPSVFEFDQRKTEFAMEENALWADLDEIDPNTLTEYPPTIAWETSPHRYQALWIVRNGDMLGASWPGGENQRLTYHIGADKGGWDTTQLLRLPAWPNHKLHYVKDHGGRPPMGKLLWKGGQWYQPDDFDDLPELSSAGTVAEDIVEKEIDRVDRDSVMGRVKLKLPKHIREFIYARSTEGQDRSSVLWQIERSLADAGCSAVEIVAVIRELVWNKYSGRHDEIRRLILEANKAVDQRPSDDGEDDDRDIVAEAADKPRPINLFLLIRDAKRPTWLVQNIWAEGSVGFIGGQPKSWKSWCALDLLLSVASGRPFLDAFTIMRPRPVLYIQEEDSAALLKDRVEKIWPAKNQPRYGLDDAGGVWVEPPPETIREGEDLPIDSLVRKGFVISDEGWMHYLAGLMEERRDADGGYGLMVIDTLLSTQGGVQDNAQEMNPRIYQPLKQLAEEYGVAIAVVHHMRKQGVGQDNVRGGQLLLGSMANHAWAENSIYMIHKRGKIMLEHESKFIEGKSYELSGLRRAGWQPSVSRHVDTSARDITFDGKARGAGATRAPVRTLPPAVVALQQLGRGIHSTRKIADQMGPDVPNSRAIQQLRRAAERGLVERASGREWRMGKS